MCVVGLWRLYATIYAIIGSVWPNIIVPSRSTCIHCTDYNWHTFLKGYWYSYVINILWYLEKWKLVSRQCVLLIYTEYSNVQSSSNMCMFVQVSYVGWYINYIIYAFSSGRVIVDFYTLMGATNTLLWFISIYHLWNESD